MGTPRVIPGIGSYEDSESARESDNRLRMYLSERLDQAIGAIEWLKTDLIKKRSFERAEEMDELSNLVEKLSRFVEASWKDRLGALGSEEVEERTLHKLFELDRALIELVGETESGIREMTTESLIPNPEDVKKIGEILANMEQKAKEREGLLKSS